MDKQWTTTITTIIRKTISTKENSYNNNGKPMEAKIFVLSKIAS